MDEEKSKLEGINYHLGRSKVDLEDAKTRLNKLKDWLYLLIRKSRHIVEDERERNDNAIFLMRGRVEDAEDDLKKQTKKVRTYELQLEECLKS